MGRGSSKVDSLWFSRDIKAGDVITPLGGAGAGGGSHPCWKQDKPSGAVFPLSHAPGSPLERGRGGRGGGVTPTRVSRVLDAQAPSRIRDVGQGLAGAGGVPMGQEEGGKGSQAAP